MFDIYPRLPKFARKLFANRYALENISVKETRAHQLSSATLVDFLFEWHREQFDKHASYATLAEQRELEPAEMEQDNLAVSAMGLLEDAAAFVFARESDVMPVRTLRSYLEARMLLSTDILEGEVPHFALNHIVSKLRRIELASAPAA